MTIQFISALFLFMREIHFYTCLIIGKQSNSVSDSSLNLSIPSGTHEQQKPAIHLHDGGIIIFYCVGTMVKRRCM